MIINHESLENVNNHIVYIIGSMFIDLFSFPPLFVIDRVYRNSEDIDSISQYIIINSKFQELLLDKIVIQPKSLPMLCQLNI